MPSSGWNVVVRYWSSSWPRLLAATVVAVFATGAMLGLLGVAGWFITASALAGLGMSQLAVAVPSAAVRCLALSRTGLRYLERLWSHQATLDGLAQLRVRVFRAAAATPARRRVQLVGADPWAGWAAKSTNWTPCLSAC